MIKKILFQRKMIVFGVALVIGIGCSFFMKLDFYDKFLTFISMIAIGFFAGNGLEHIGDGMKAMRSTEEDND